MINDSCVQCIDIMANDCITVNILPRECQLLVKSRLPAMNNYERSKTLLGRIEGPHSRNNCLNSIMLSLLQKVSNFMLVSLFKFKRWSNNLWACG